MFWRMFLVDILSEWVLMLLPLSAELYPPARSEICLGLSEIIKDSRLSDIFLLTTSGVGGLRHIEGIDDKPLPSTPANNKCVGFFGGRLSLRSKRAGLS